ncbi:acyltransferase [Tunturiibacter empetritectus]|uniref:Peptidoglycan/LPS O-acetylase OafA/YrhL n=2 Tax=Tunturiibacter TaxID=3154218 RepID=A0A852V6I9_9BACT|nr:acyltransferase [Edaphobacter lichenicola]NYF88513.1 peptidoglycan/LPS O-acetylase OafA/YrhL [Edaphobacter lichenicola]
MRIHSLDGLRAVAVLAVILHHHEILRGGWVGVDLFFVLSGYLITQILRRDRLLPHYWKRFYIKRATRILPPVLLLIAYVAMAFKPRTLSVLAYLGFMGNFASASNWVIPNLIMLWSLAVEEHFYLMFPIAVRYMQRRHLKILLLGLLLIEPMLRFLATPHVRDYEQIYFLTPFHLDGLAMGCLLAIWSETERGKALLTRWSGTTLLVSWAWFTLMSRAWPHVFDREANTQIFNTLGYSLLGVCCASLVAYVLTHPDGALNRALSWKPLTFIGIISYGLYLCHQPVRSAFTGATGLSSRVAFPITLSLAILVSWISFRWFEAPLIRWGHKLASVWRADRLDTTVTVVDA